jgi:hypothetical protein
MALARVRNRILAYFGVEELEEETESSLFKSALGMLMGAIVVGALFGLFERDVAAGAFVGASWLGLMILWTAWARRRARRSS